MAPSPPPPEIRDPIHGVVSLDRAELAVIDHPFVQRLRGIRQLGFSHLPFPGATHTRYAHSLGAMHLGGAAFDAIFRDGLLGGGPREAALRHCLRLGALCHDLGHAPFSHASEFAMPPLGALGIRAYDPAQVAGRLHERAHHEDYTVAILTETSLGQRIAEHFPFTARHVAALVSPDVALDDDFFIEDGIDLRPLLSQLVSSELDVDRMDYLVRDSWFTGARYGEVDTRWLISNLSRHLAAGDQAMLAIDRRAIYAFDDFMIARFHMFIMVYFHSKSVAYEEMLKRFVTEPGCPYQLPHDMDAYRATDDAALLGVLRQSDSPWARRVVELDPYRLAVEVHGTADTVDLSAARALLAEAGIEALFCETRGAVFKPEKPGRPRLFVLDRGGLGTATRALPLHEATEIFHRYRDARAIARLYVAGEHVARARELLRACEGTP